MKTAKHLIEFSDTGYFSDIFIDYIKSDKKLLPFYQYRPDLSSFQQAISDIQKQSYNRNLLVKVIEEQYKNSRLQTSNFRLLTDESTFTICTGHQLCLFTGPLYFIYKIITTINLAEELKKAYPEYNFVPVYWMAGEDHDFEEVNHVHVYGRKIEWKKEAATGSNRQSGVGNIKTETIKSTIEELRSILGNSNNAAELIKLFEDGYLKNKTLADATRYLVHALFGEYGLVIVDGNDKRLKKEFSPIIKDDIFNNTNHKLVNSTIQQLADAGYKSQVNPREINVFYMTDELRERIIPDSLTLKVESLKLSFTKEEIETEIDSEPGRFSPNVVLRPLYQQKILPNLAYVGGPAEMAYWLEYKTMFDHHKIPFPVLVPRNSVMWIDKNTDEQMRKLDISIEDLFKPADGLIKQFLEKNAQEEFSLKKEEEKLSALYKEIAAKAEKVDPTLKPAVEAELRKHLHALKNMEGKIVRAEKQKHEHSINKIKKIKERLFPGNALQERHENFMSLYVSHGRNLFKVLIESLRPFELKLTVLREI